jgi:hypothetical protein
MRFPSSRIWMTAAVLATASGCGSVSDLKPNVAGGPVDLSAYTRVVVMPLTDRLKADGNSGTEAKAAVLRFRQNLIEQLRLSGAFTEVLSVPGPAEGSLRIDGVVTRAVEGNRTQRLWVGFGAGNAYFDATVEVRDDMTGALLATWTADRNSWGGGGWIAAQQTLDSFIDEAARKIAHDLAAARIRGRIDHSAPGGK